MTDIPASEPYYQPPPFVGRQAILTRLRQHLIDPVDRRALLITGRDQIGKSALLRYFNTSAGNDFLSVYLPLEHVDLTDEHEWLDILVEGTNESFTRRDFSLSRLPEIPQQAEGFRQWLLETYLETLTNIIRPHRRVVWLIDDATLLLDAIRSGNLPPDHLTYLHRLLTEHHQLGIVLTLNTRDEGLLAEFAPLVSEDHTIRLGRLTEEESTELLRILTPGITEETGAAVYQAAGGMPGLVHRFGGYLSQYPSAPAGEPALVKQAARDILQRSAAEFARDWEHLNSDERAVLTAMSALVYNDPLRPIDTMRIDSWLVETDHPLDPISINAALRSLEYRELVTRREGAAQFTIGMMQRWVLERDWQPGSQTVDAGHVPRRRLVLLILAAGVVLALLIALLTRSPAVIVVEEGEQPVATVTLDNTGG